MIRKLISLEIEIFGMISGREFASSRAYDALIIQKQLVFSISITTRLMQHLQRASSLITFVIPGYRNKNVFQIDEFHSERAKTVMFVIYLCWNRFVIICPALRRTTSNTRYIDFWRTLHLTWLQIIIIHIPMDDFIRTWVFKCVYFAHFGKLRKESAGNILSLYIFTHDTYKQYSLFNNGNVLWVACRSTGILMVCLNQI